MTKFTRSFIRTNHIKRLKKTKNIIRLLQPKLRALRANLIIFTGLLKTRTLISFHEF